MRTTRPSTGCPPILPGARGTTRAHSDLGRGMVSHMRTTLNIDDSVMRRLREVAVQRRTTMSALVEAGLRRVLAEPGPPDSQSTKLPPLPTWNGGRELVDISNRDSLYEVMEEQ